MVCCPLIASILSLFVLRVTKFFCFFFAACFTCTPDRHNKLFTSNNHMCQLNAFLTATYQCMFMIFFIGGPQPILPLKMGDCYMMRLWILFFYCCLLKLNCSIDHFTKDRCHYANQLTLLF